MIRFTFLERMQTVLWERQGFNLSKNLNFFMMNMQKLLSQLLWIRARGTGHNSIDSILIIYYLGARAVLGNTSPRFFAQLELVPSKNCIVSTSFVVFSQETVWTNLPAGQSVHSMGFPVLYGIYRLAINQSNSRNPVSMSWSYNN